MIRNSGIFVFIVALAASGLSAFAQNDAVTGVFPRERILSQTIGDANISLSMDYTRTSYQLEQSGFAADASNDARMMNFLAQGPKYCELGGRAPAFLSFAYTRRVDTGVLQYTLTWQPDAEGQYVPRRIDYVLRTERGLPRSAFYQFIPGMERGQSLEPYCGERRPSTCNVFSVSEGRPENIRYHDARIYMNRDSNSVRAERRDLPDTENICRY